MEGSFSSVVSFDITLVIVSGVDVGIGVVSGISTILSVAAGGGIVVTGIGSSVACLSGIWVVGTSASVVVATGTLTLTGCSVVWMLFVKYGVNFSGVG